MKFRRQIKEEKAFKTTGICLLLSDAAFIIMYLITSNTVFLRLLAASFFAIAPCFISVYSARRDYIEFQKDRIVFINHIAPSNEIKIAEIEVIMIPSTQALKSKMKDNDIIFKKI